MVHQHKSKIYGDCNTGVSVIKKKGKLGNMYTWINSEGIANTISIPKLDTAGYHITYDTK